MRDALLYYEDEIFVINDTSLKKIIFNEYHDSLLAGHFGTTRTIELIRRKFWWPTMNKEISHYVKTFLAYQWTLLPHCQRVIHLIQF